MDSIRIVLTSMRPSVLSSGKTGCEEVARQNRGQVREPWWKRGNFNSFIAFCIDDRRGVFPHLLTDQRRALFAPVDNDPHALQLEEDVVGIVGSLQARRIIVFRRHDGSLFLRECWLVMTQCCIASCWWRSAWWLRNEIMSNQIVRPLTAKTPSSYASSTTAKRRLGVRTRWLAFAFGVVASLLIRSLLIRSLL